MNISPLAGGIKGGKVNNSLFRLKGELNNSRHVIH